MIVLDASAAVELLGDTQAGKRILARLSTERVLHAPHLLDLEVASAFRRQAALGAVDAERVARALALHRSLRIMRHPHYPYLDRIWDLRHNFSAYDACYIALSEALGATLLTRDKALALARLQRGNVEVI
jgi:predicted nucleic acid-binding protein